MGNTISTMLSNNASPEQLSGYLDHLGRKGRLDAILGLGQREMSAIYALVEGVFELTFDHFVPPEVGPLQEVIHEGINSLPAFRRFQKRFCRPSSADWPVLWGYNEQWYRRFSGPGYFVAREGWPIDPVVIDYIEPARERAPGWPELAPSHAKLGRFIYKNTIDRMRKVSEHVTIGAAFTEGRPMHVYFMLVRSTR